MDDSTSRYELEELVVQPGTYFNPQTEVVVIVDDSASARTLMRQVAREAGVRGLEREVGAVCRNVAMRLAEGQDVHEVTTPEMVQKVLGPPKYTPDLAERTSQPGVATGLAWTPSGGDILFIEATQMPGRGEVVVTGNLKSVMQESASAAVSFVRSRAGDLGLDPEFMKTIDLHLHVPKGGTPKDGPSAGITMFAALSSLLLKCALKKHVAMTGEITLRGNVLPVGGIKEKLLAAHRAGIKRVVMPERNSKDMVDVPDQPKSEMEFFFVKRMDELLPLVLTEVPERLKSFVEAPQVIIPPPNTPPPVTPTTSA